MARSKFLTGCVTLVLLALGLVIFGRSLIRGNDNAIDEIDADETAGRFEASPALRSDGLPTDGRVGADMERIRIAYRNAVRLQKIQPPAALIEKLELRPEVGSENVKLASEYSESDLSYQPEGTLLVNDVPYWSYYSLKKGSSHVLHPMRMGRFLGENAKSARANEIATAVLGMAYELPNGGLAWYYPRHYAVSRMMGHDLKYSCISQGSLLSGFIEYEEHNKGIELDIARRAFLAMMWPYEKSGVNLSGVAVLEMPSFSGAPEIILNGWIDSLLNIREYAQLRDDDEAWAFFRRNIAFMAEILPVFDAPEANISRYSDLSPYRATVTLAEAKDVASLEVLYMPRHRALEPVLVPLSLTPDASNFSIYENQIVAQQDSVAMAWISCSQLYDTVLMARTDAMSLVLDKGVIHRERTTPGFGGEEFVCEGVALGEGIRAATLSSEDGLICGYPTNFLKKGKTNSYHVYHAVGLMILALGDGINDVEQKRVLLEWAIKWHGDMQILEETEALNFMSEQLWFERLNRGRSVVPQKNFDALMDAAKALVK